MTLLMALPSQRPQDRRRQRQQQQKRVVKLVRGCYSSCGPVLLQKTWPSVSQSPVPPSINNLLPIYIITVGVKVVVRVRKLLGHELMEGCTNCVLVEGEGGQEEDPLMPPPQQLVILDKAFEFDHVFSPEVEQAAVYRQTAKPLLEKFFAGFNTTVLAYGQTGRPSSHVLIV